MFLLLLSYAGASEISPPHDPVAIMCKYVVPYVNTPALIKCTTAVILPVAGSGSDFCLSMLFEVPVSGSREIIIKIIKDKQHDRNTWKTSSNSREAVSLASPQPGAIHSYYWYKMCYMCEESEQLAQLMTANPTFNNVHVVWVSLLPLTIKIQNKAAWAADTRQAYRVMTLS